MAKAKKAAKAASAAGGFTAPNGQQDGVAPKNWPFGTRRPEATPPDESQTAHDHAARRPRELPLELMYRLMEESDDPRMQLQAAIAAAPYVHPKLTPIKKDDKEKKVNRFAALVARPPLRVVEK
jgi:hypothetical protein